MFHTTNHIEIYCKIFPQQRAGYHLVDNKVPAQDITKVQVQQHRLIVISDNRVIDNKVPTQVPALEEQPTVRLPICHHEQEHLDMSGAS